MKNLKKFYLLLVALTIITVSCQKQVDTSSDIAQLKASVTALQKRTDSLSAALTNSNNALTNTNNNLSLVNSKVDSIKTQITGILLQINQLSLQLTQMNANITSINSQITSLNTQLSNLVSQLNAIIAQLLFNPRDLLSGLVGWYLFSGNSLDSSGYGNDAINSGGVLTTDRFGRTNNAYYFNNTINAYMVSNNIPIILTSAYTFSYWQNMKGFNEGNLVLELTKGQLGDLNPAIWQHNNKIFLTSSTGAGYYQMLIDTTSNLLNKWVNLTWTVSSGITNLYENGLLVTTSNSMPWSADAMLTLTLANNGNNASPLHSQPSNVSLDDIRIYNRVLTSSEIYYLGTH